MYNQVRARKLRRTSWSVSSGSIFRNNAFKIGEAKNYTAQAYSLDVFIC